MHISAFKSRKKDISHVVDIIPVTLALLDMLITFKPSAIKKLKTEMVRCCGEIIEYITQQMLNLSNNNDRNQYVVLHSIRNCFSLMFVIR